LSTLAATPERLECPLVVTDPVAEEARKGLLATPRTLAPWLFYDEQGSQLFEQITALPEYYLTRTERGLFREYADQIFRTLNANLTIVELGAGTAAKTGILLTALSRYQPEVLYQPIDISSTALDQARQAIERSHVRVRPQVANYITEPFTIERPPASRILALYIGSSIGNFSPAEARGILANLRAQLKPGDSLLLGTDLAPGPNKSIDTLVRAYDDDAGVTAAFNRNVLARLNRDLGSNFDPQAFAHVALWNPVDSRVEMHLRALTPQYVDMPANGAGPAFHLAFRAGEGIHTENSYKFTNASIASLLAESGFAAAHTFTDAGNLFAVTLAVVV